MNTPSPEVIETLKAGMRGPVILPDDPTYEQDRRIWNAIIDKHPAAIAQCSGVADVMHAVRVACDEGLLISVRGGGHNIAGNAICDDGLTIDLSAQRSVHIDPEARRAYVAPGATLGDLDHEAQGPGDSCLHSPGWHDCHAR